MEAVDGDDRRWPFEAFESGNGAVEDVVGGPEVLPVGVSVGIAAFSVDGVATWMR